MSAQFIVFNDRADDTYSYHWTLKRSTNTALFFDRSTLFAVLQDSALLFFSLYNSQFVMFQFFSFIHRKSDVAAV